MRSRGLSRRKIARKRKRVSSENVFEKLLKTTEFLREFEADWFVAGGWAIDLFLERQTRPHADVDVAIFRKDQLALQKHLGEWILKKAEKGVLSEWKQGEFLELPVHEIHCLNHRHEPQFFEILLNETNGENWIFRRNKNIAKPLAELFLTSNYGVKFLCPEAVLLYKAKNPQPKDEMDFQAIVNLLHPESRNWLKSALSVCHAEQQ